jgi:hypothetical protein
MALVDDIYRKVSEDMARMPTPGLDADARRIYMMIATMCDWGWRRLGEPGFSFVEWVVRNRQDYVPETDEEVAIWDELTAPHNYKPLVRYIDLRGSNVNDGIARVHAKLLETARHRLESQ